MPHTPYARNFGGSALGWIEVDFCNQKFILQHLQFFRDQILYHAPAVVSDVHFLYGFIHWFLCLSSSSVRVWTDQRIRDSSRQALKEDSGGQAFKSVGSPI